MFIAKCSQIVIRKIKKIDKIYIVLQIIICFNIFTHLMSEVTLYTVHQSTDNSTSNRYFDSTDINIKLICSCTHYTHTHTQTKYVSKFGFDITRTVTFPFPPNFVCRCSPKILTYRFHTHIYMNTACGGTRAVVFAVNKKK